MANKYKRPGFGVLLELLSPCLGGNDHSFTISSYTGFKICNERFCSRSLCMDFYYVMSPICQSDGKHHNIKSPRRSHITEINVL